MSDVFTADYSECRDTKREISSNLTYISEILGRLDKVNNFINDTDVDSSVWDRSSYYKDYANLCGYLNEETTRYNNFCNTFHNFYTSLSGIDKNLASQLTDFLAYAEQNGSYDYYMGVILIDDEDESIDSIYNLLKDKGFSEEQASMTAMLYDPEIKKLCGELANLSDDELQTRFEEIMDKKEGDKSVSEKVFIDFLALNSKSTWATIINQMTSDLQKDECILPFAQKYIFKDKSIQNDMKSLQGEINILNRMKDNGLHSKVKKGKISDKLDDLVALRNKGGAAGARKIKFAKGVLESHAQASDMVTYGLYAFDEVVEGINMHNYGTEIVDIMGEVTNDTLAFAAGTVGWKAGASIGAKAGAEIGTYIYPGLGTAIGTLGGSLVGGFAGSGFFTAGYKKYLEDPVSNLYNNSVKESYESMGNSMNNLGDWWDTLCW